MIPIVVREIRFLLSVRSRSCVRKCSSSASADVALNSASVLKRSASSRSLLAWYLSSWTTLSFFKLKLKLSLDSPDNFFALPIGLFELSLKAFLLLSKRNILGRDCRLNVFADLAFVFRLVDSIKKEVIG